MTVPADSQLASSLNSLTSMSQQLSLSSPPLSPLFLPLSSLLKSIVERRSASCDYSITEEGLESVSYSGGWITHIAQDVEDGLRDMAGWMGNDAREALWTFALEDITRMVEIVLRKKSERTMAALTFPRLTFPSLILFHI